MSSSVERGVRDAVGRRLDGRYRVLEHIADGGMASVYLALDERLDREVAVKVMRRDLVSDETFVSRFRREARSAARLSHPHVVAVHDQGDDDGDMFLAMEYVPGRTLREVIREESPLPARAALDLLDPILQALEAAHSAGLIHRDVKPENVIIRDDGVVKVADFGLARAVTAATTTNAAGTLMGTVAYLSPEQVERGIADARSDVYAAGLVLFEMLTGRKAFDGDTPIHVAYQHVHGSVPVASDVVATVPPELDGLVALGTARDPDQRPGSGGDYLVALRRTRRGLGTDELDLAPDPPRDPAHTMPVAMLSPTTAIPVVRARPDATDEARGGAAGTSYAQQPQERRRRRWPAVVALLLVLAVGGGGAGWWFTLGPGNTTVVPTLRGLSQTAAMQAVSTAELEASVTDAFSETVATGTVIEATPAAGGEVRKHSAVDLVVSKGPERYAAPTLTGKPVSAAQALLAQNSLTLGAQTPAFSETVPAGVVVTQDPAPSTSLKKGTAVAVTVSRGRQPIPVTDWTGKPLADAKAGLTTAGLQVVEGTAVNSDTVPEGAVVSQSPASGSLFKGDKVTLVVSKGPVLVAVPETVGKQRAEARTILEQAGFTVKFTEVLGGFFGTVRTSDPAAGTMVRKGSTITLTIV